VYNPFLTHDRLLSDEVPYEDHIRDDVVLNKDDTVMAAVAVAGVPPDTADAVDIANWFDRLHGALLNIAAEDVEISIMQCRGEADRSMVHPGIHRADYARELSADYIDNLFAGSLYSNRLFIFVLIHPPSSVAKAVRSVRQTREEIEARADRLHELCRLLQVQLADFGPRRLGYVERGHGIFDEIAEAIVFAVTGIPRQIGATTGRMGNAMFSEAVRFPSRKKWIEIHGAGDVSYAAMFAMREYPMRTWPGMFYALAVAPYRCTLAQSFRFLSNAAGVSAVSRKQNMMVVAGDKAASQTVALSLAADELMSRKWALGDHSLVVIAFAGDKASLADVANAVWRDLAAAVLVATRLTKALQAGLLSILPGGDRWRPRPGFVKSSNLVCMAPLYNFPAGQERGHWGPPIATFRTLAGTPYLFHWHVRDVGSAFVTGMPGSGKTFLTAALIAFTAGRARIVALDHKRGWDLLIHRLLGDYAVLGAGEASFAPLKALDGSPRNMEFLTDLFRGCIGGKMTEEEGRRLAIGLSIIMSLPPGDRSVGELRGFFDDEPEGAGVRLEKWIFGNDLGWVVDAPADTVRFGDLTGLDTTALLDNERARGPALLYLFHRIFLLLDGSPLLIPIDEGWRALLDPVFRATIEKLLRTIRSKGGVLVFITQSPGDIVESGIARILIEMCPTQIHLPNPRATRADYVDGMKMTEGAWQAFRPLQGGTGVFLLNQGDKSLVAQLPMAGLTRHIAVLSAGEKDLALMDSIRADGLAGDAAFEKFHRTKEGIAA
jgi:type IV secretion system protein VirB4